VIYFVQDTVQGFVKIGQTDGDLLPRLSSLQTGNPNVLRCIGVIDGETDDRVYHRRFAAHQHMREWFRPEADLMAFIAGLPVSKYTNVQAVGARAQVYRRSNHWRMKPNYRALQYLHDIQDSLRTDSKGVIGRNGDNSD
jgi:hypothetical protein